MNEQRPIEALRCHPDCERVPMASGEDLANLRASLAENGQQDPIDVTSDNLILDGRTRWTLLKGLGAESIQVRVVYIPPEQQTHYIVRRALDRRQLTTEQKRALNALLREEVIEVVVHPITAQPVRIGKGQSERAEMLGVTRETVKHWDKAEAAGNILPPGSQPTHIRLSTGRIQPLHPGKTPSEPRAPKLPPLKQASKTQRLSPPWKRHYTLWCRSVLPEDRPHLLDMSRELHKALGLLGLSCTVTQEKD